MTILTCFLLFLIPHAASLTFNFTNFTTDSQEISLHGEATISNGGIQVTSENRSDDITWSYAAGRATYIAPFHLWDKTSRELASFSTTFTFVIDSDNVVTYADGLTFFLAQNYSVIMNVYGGESLGLPYDVKGNISTNPFVAVEFDTYAGNINDVLNTSHVGIDVNTLVSVRSRPWFTDIPNGRECQAWIEYDSVSKNLSVSFTQNNTLAKKDGLYYIIDLRDVLPDWVIFGFSAATATYFEKHIVKSWMFNSSSLEVGLASPSRGYRLGLIIGLPILFAFLAMLGFVLWRRKKRNNKDEMEELEFDVEMNNEFEMGKSGPRK